METPLHSLNSLFAQLGLPADTVAIDTFIQRHRPLANHTRLADAPCWTPAQASLLREQVQLDADWAGIVDQLDARLRD